MNTFGLKRKVHSFGLGKLRLSVVDAYHEIQRFSLSIYTKIKFRLMR